MTQLSLLAFLEVVKTANISDAAKNMFISQPALSRRIMALEDELGILLFKRSKGSRFLELTAEGERFIPIAEKWLSAWRESRNIKNTCHTIPFTILGNTGMANYLYPVIRKLLSAVPGISIDFHGYHSLEEYHWIEYGKADIALISNDMYFGSVETTPAYKEKMLLVSKGIYQDVTSILATELDTSFELFVPWHPEFVAWHHYWYGSRSAPILSIDQFSLAQLFFQSEETWWSIIPSTALGGIRIICPEISVCELIDPPPDRRMY